MQNNFQVVIPQTSGQEIMKNVLFISDLPQKTTEVDLWMFFEDYKDKIIVINITSGVKNQDPYSPRPSSAKVIFRDFKAADEARKAKNMNKIKGKTIRVMWDERDNNLRYNSQGNLFIKNIPFEVKPREFYDFFLQFGDVSSCKLPEDDDGNHMGYGYINYYEPDSASRAIQAADGQEIWGSKLEVKYFQRKNERLVSFPHTNNYVYLKNFPSNFTEEDIRKLCLPYGEVLICKISLDDSSRSSAFVSFANEESASIAREALNGHKLGNDQELFVNTLMSKYEREKIRSNKISDNNYKLNEQYKYCNLHIRNIPYHATEEDISEVFSKFGPIKSVKIEKYVLVTKINNQLKEIPTSKGFGYVCFEDPEAARTAFEAMNDKFILKFESWKRPLIIEYFMPKNERTPIVVNKINQTNSFNNFSPKMPMMNPMMPRLNMNLHPNANMINPNMPNVFNSNMKFMPNMNMFENNMMMTPQQDRNPPREKRRAPQQATPPQIKSQTVEKDELDYKYIETLDYDSKKDYLGEYIFKRIENHKLSQDNNLTIDTIGKVTGMILGIEDISEIIDIYRNQENLSSRIKEALELIVKG